MAVHGMVSARTTRRAAPRTTAATSMLYCRNSLLGVSMSTKASPSSAARSAVHGERVTEHRPAALGLRLRRLVLDDVPVLDEDPILNAQDVRSDPVRGRPEARKTA